MDGLKLGWQLVRARYTQVRRLVIYLANGPNTSGTRTQFLQRLVELADWTGLTLHLVYYPPYPSKYNPIERCWSVLEKKWKGVLLSCLKIVLRCVLRMFWKGEHPTIKCLKGDYPEGVRVSGRAKKELESRLERSPALPKYDIIIRPRQVN